MNPDHGYDLLVKTIIPLNHDRYKSYFNQFAVMNFSLLVAISTQQLQYLKIPLSIIGIILSLCWLLVLYKIRDDIKKTWKAIKKYEEGPSCDQIVKITETEKMKTHASTVMLCIPLLFIIVYLMILTSFYRCP